jgi:hypothetical protein
MQKLPKVKIQKIKLSDNCFNDNGYKYSSFKLIEHSKQFKEFDLPLVGVNLSTMAWGISDMDDFIFHVKRCVDADLKYPIILDTVGRVCDGWHRICKSIVLGNKSIKAIRLETMPDYDSYEKPNEEE